MGPEEELRELRRRVYGRDAEPGDHEAARRLAELEGRKNAETVPEPKAPIAPAATPATEPAPAATAASEPAATPSPEPEPAPEPVREPATLRRRLRPAHVLWAATLVTVLVVVYIVGSTVARYRSGEIDPPSSVVAVLARDESFDAEMMSLTAYESFAGLRAFMSALDSAAPVCIWAVDEAGLDITPEGWSSAGRAYQGCGGGAFAPSVSLEVTADSPEAMRDEYPEGTSFRLVYSEENDEIVVFRADEAE